MKFRIRFKRLLKNSLITGVPQIIVTRNAFRKGLKIVVFLGCLFGLQWQTFSFLAVYWTYPTVVDVQYLFPDDFPMPALSVCSSNGIKSELFCERFPELCYPNRSLKEFCFNNPFFCDRNQENFPENVSFPTVTPRQLPPLSRDEYSAMGVQKEELVISCTIYDSPKVMDCSKDYQKVHVFDSKGLPTNCYAFHSLWGRTEKARVIKTKTVLIFVLRSEVTQRNHFYTGSTFALQVAIHSPNSLINPFLNGFSIKPCSNYYIFPSKQESELLPPPYSSRCYNYSQTRKIRLGKSPMTKRLCAEECYLNKSVMRLGCVDPFYVTYPNKEKICSESVPKEIYQECRGFCRPACVREIINSDVQEHSTYASEERSTRRNLTHCASLLTVLFNRMEVVKYIYSAKYESVSLFSYIGGYLGLWLGISLVAICDVLETAVLVLQWIWERIYDYRRARRWQKRRDNTRMHKQRNVWIL